MFDESQLFRGADYKVNGSITVRQPKLGEILDYGEKGYYSVVNALTCNPSAYKVALYDMGVDYETIGEFNFFFLMCGSLTVNETCLLLGELDLSGFRLVKSKDTGELVMANPDGVIIDKTVHFLIADYIRKMHGIEKQTDKAGNALTKQYLIDKERRRIKWQQTQPYQPVLMPLVSAMVNCEQFKYNHESVQTLPVYVFNDSVRRIQKAKIHDFVMTGCHNGVIDMSKINLEELNWLN